VLRRTLSGIGRGLLGLIALVALLLTITLTYAELRRASQETRPRTQAAPPGGRWVRAHDVDIHLREWGEAGGRTLLLVHGTGAWSGTWIGNVAAMAAAGFRVVAMDLPPFGFSGLPVNADYGRQTQARRILAVIAQLGPESVTLLGHSFGGGPATEAAMLDPRRIEHLVLVDAAIGLRAGPEQDCELPAGLATVLAWRGLRTGLVAAVGTEPALSQFWLRQFVARQEVVTTERTAIYQQPFSGSNFSAGLGDWAYQFAASCETPASTLPKNFRALAIPVSLVWGALDSITPVEQAQQLRALLPRSRLTLLPGVGHIPQIEDAAQFNREIAKVLVAAP